LPGGQRNRRLPRARTGGNRSRSLGSRGQSVARADERGTADEDGMSQPRISGQPADGSDPCVVPPEVHDSGCDDYGGICPFDRETTQFPTSHADDLIPREGQIGTTIHAFTSPSDLAAQALTPSYTNTNYGGLGSNPRTGQDHGLRSEATPDLPSTYFKAAHTLHSTPQKRPYGSLVETQKLDPGYSNSLHWAGNEFLKGDDTQVTKKKRASLSTKPESAEHPVLDTKRILSSFPDYAPPPPVMSPLRCTSR